MNSQSNFVADEGIRLKRSDFPARCNENKNKFIFHGRGLRTSAVRLSMGQPEVFLKLGKPVVY